jgi:FkbM family methyltransferase
MFKALARLFGYEVIHRRKSPTLEPHLRLILRQRGIDLVIDVGANAGQFGAALRRLGYQGRILSFEPVTSTFERLQQRAAGDPHWQVFKLALGERREMLTINAFDSSDLSSILDPSALGVANYAAMRTVRKEVIEVDTLDHVLESHGSSASRLMLKMDTQGYDLKVYRGAASTLGRVQALVSELSFQPIYEGMPDYRQMLAEFESAGFAVSGLFPVSRNPDLSVIEMDCVLVRQVAPTA